MPQSRGVEGRYYAWRSRKPSARDRLDELLGQEIAGVHRRSKARYGSPRVHAELRASGLQVGRKRVARLMQLQGLKGKKARRRVRTTDSSHHYPVAENVLGRRFRVANPDRAWACDITYFATKQGWLYLAIVIDLFSRRIVGWSMSEFIDAKLVISALSMALATRRPSTGLVVHSDRGSQYACRDYRNFIHEHGICRQHKPQARLLG